MIILLLPLLCPFNCPTKHPCIWSENESSMLLRLHMLNIDQIYDVNSLVHMFIVMVAVDKPIVIVITNNDWYCCNE